ncbi:DNA-directed RNA polymerase subunit omega [Pilibacter termitis]|uniref:DNA-directed RNA polymerase subunit omega n=1 Tax=Pilibacter termitis TaxID=263852 RepID=A0A1T4PXQ1_9ENTE|nr:DNA-directed RNA polymerase subunit omega [Pilibacter termitis]SJZ96087.1 DNA-directed RNA polymerase subunit omega [Pilibacter termitis]
MMLKPSIDTLLDKVNSKYSLVILSSKRAHELEAGNMPTMESFQSVKPVLKALEEIEAGTVTNHPDPEGKRELIRKEEEARRKIAEEEQEKLKKQIEEEQGNM